MLNCLDCTPCLRTPYVLRNRIHTISCLRTNRTDLPRRTCQNTSKIHSSSLKCEQNNKNYFREVRKKLNSFRHHKKKSNGSPVIALLACEAFQMVNIVLRSHNHFKCGYNFHARRTLASGSKQPGTARRDINYILSNGFSYKSNEQATTTVHQKILPNIFQDIT